MLDQQDLVLLQGMMDKTIKNALQQNNSDLKRDIREEVHALIAASESRTAKKIESEVRQLRSDIISDVADILDSLILPQIHELQTDMAIVKQHLKLA